MQHEVQRREVSNLLDRFKMFGDIRGNIRFSYAVDKNVQKLLSIDNITGKRIRALKMNKFCKGYMKEVEKIPHTLKTEERSVKLDELQKADPSGFEAYKEHIKLINEILDQVDIWEVFTMKDAECFPDSLSAADLDFLRYITPDKVFEELEKKLFPETIDKS